MYIVHVKVYSESMGTLDNVLFAGYSTIPKNGKRAKQLRNSFCQANLEQKAFQQHKQSHFFLLTTVHINANLSHNCVFADTSAYLLISVTMEE